LPPSTKPRVALAFDVVHVGSGVLVVLVVVVVAVDAAGEMDGERRGTTAVGQSLAQRVGGRCSLANRAKCLLNKRSKKGAS
jgi:hypothetical protein